MRTKHVSMKGRKLPTPYFDRTITDTGTSKTIAIKGIIPDDWESVRIVPKKIRAHCITVELYKTKLVVETAPTPQADKDREQNP